MNKLFFYELRMIVCSKFYWGFVAISLCFGWQILSTRTVQGVAHTAPFSPWSFGSYLAEMLPLLSVALFFFLWSFFSAKARRVETLTAATPTPPARHLAIKCAAAATAWLALAFCTVLLGIVFLLVIFGASVPVSALLAPTLMVLLPVLIFLLGLGLLVGSTRPSLLLFVLIPLFLLLYLLPLPAAVDLLGADFFTAYPLSLSTLDPGFSVPGSVVMGKLSYTLLGGVLLLYTVLYKKGRRMGSRLMK
ncbi:hypothetical protein [Paenibacillus sp. BAC0078]